MKKLLQDNFERIYCINLDGRPDRWAECQEEFKKYNIQDIVTRWPATRLEKVEFKRNRAHGCADSHVRVIKKAKEDKLKNVLIFEDDIEFLKYYLRRGRVVESNPVDILEKGLNQLKNINWDMFYLGYSIKILNFCNFKQLAANLFQSTLQLVTHSYAVDSNIYDNIIHDDPAGKATLDEYYAYYLNPKVNAVNLCPLIAHQRDSYSDILNKDRQDITTWVDRNLRHFGQKCQLE